MLMGNIILKSNNATGTLKMVMERKCGEDAATKLEIYYDDYKPVGGYIVFAKL